MTEWEAERSAAGTTLSTFAIILFSLEAAVLFYAYHDARMGRLLLDAGRSLSGRLKYLVATRFLEEDFNIAILLLKALIMLSCAVFLSISCIWAHPVVSRGLSVLMALVIASSVLYPLSIPLVGVNVVLGCVFAISHAFLTSPRLRDLRSLTLTPLKDAQARRGPEPFLYGPSPIPF